jgi:hypothetical protein
VSSVVKHKEFTLESFSELDLAGTEWNYANTPKTFTITYDTLLLTDAGVTRLDMFDGRGPHDYTNPPRTVYVLSDGTDALAISTAPFGAENIKGVIMGVRGQELDAEGNVIKEPSAIVAGMATIYDRGKYEWTKTNKEHEIAIATNTLIVKNGAPIRPSDLAEADAVRIIKAGDSRASNAGKAPYDAIYVEEAPIGAACVIIVEN